MKSAVGRHPSITPPDNGRSASVAKAIDSPPSLNRRQDRFAAKPGAPTTASVREPPRERGFRPRQRRRAPSPLSTSPFRAADFLWATGNLLREKAAARLEAGDFPRQARNLPFRTARLQRLAAPRPFGDPTSLRREGDFPFEGATSPLCRAMCALRGPASRLRIASGSLAAACERFRDPKSKI